MGKSLTNVTTLLTIVALVSTFVFLIQLGGTMLEGNSNANLDNDSATYLASIRGIDLENYTLTSEQVKEGVAESNITGSSTQDFSISYLDSKKKLSSLWTFLGGIYKIPETILKIFRINTGEMGYILKIINFMFWVSIILAIVYAWKGVVT